MRREAQRAQRALYTRLLADTLTRSHAHTLTRTNAHTIILKVRRSCKKSQEGTEGEREGGCKEAKTGVTQEREEGRR